MRKMFRKCVFLKSKWCEKWFSICLFPFLNEREWLTRSCVTDKQHPARHSHLFLLNWMFYGHAVKDSVKGGGGAWTCRAGLWSQEQGQCLNSTTSPGTQEDRWWLGVQPDLDLNKGIQWTQNSVYPHTPLFRHVENTHTIYKLLFMLHMLECHIKKYLFEESTNFAVLRDQTWASAAASTNVNKGSLMMFVT